MQKRTKILYVVTKSSWGGAQKYIYDLATHLPKDRFDVVVTAGGNGALFSKLQSAGIRTLPIPGLERDIHIGKEVVSLWHLFCIFLREKPDIVHLNSSKAGGLGAVAARLASFAMGLRSLIVFTVHGWAFFESRPRWQNLLIRFASSLGTLFQDRIILLDRMDYETALRFIPKRKCILIPNGIPTLDFLPRIDARRALAERIGHPISDNTILIGTIAELTKNKGLSYLIEALRNLQPTTYNLQVIIIGDGELRTALIKQIKEGGLQNALFLAGPIPDASHFLQAFNIFVLPSLKEGLPYSIMEAMAAGLPIVATAVGGIPDMITDGREGVLVEPRNPNALADAILRLIQSPDLRRTMGSAARTRAAEKFSLSRTVTRTAALYDTH